LNDAAASLEGKLVEAKNSLSALRERARSAEGVAREIPLLEKQLRDCRAEQARLAAEAEALRRQTAGDEVELAEVQKKALPSASSDAQIKADLDALRKKSGLLAGECGALGTKLLEYEELERRGVCPTCGQPTSGAGFDAKKAPLQARFKEKAAAREESEAKQRSLEEALEEFHDSQRAVKRVKEIEAKIADARRRQADAAERVARLAVEIPGIEESLSRKKAELEASAGLRDSLARAEQAQAKLEGELRASSAERGAVEREAALLEKRAGELAEKISVKLAKRARLEDLREKRAWLSECFVVALESVEQSVLASIQADFDAALQEFFTLLVEEGSLAVRASESFAPLVSQDGFEQNAQALSGGEKSALALAYRLALNKVVRSATPSLKENVLILDEPTDGFSKEQLARMRDVLDAVAAEQVLLVSHERELESFADRVHRIIKEAGASRIE
jgi:exonuclease SbcC